VRKSPVASGGGGGGGGNCLGARLTAGDDGGGRIPFEARIPREWRWPLLSFCQLSFSSVFPLKGLDPRSVRDVVLNT
jgi:hypothetical protein